MDKKGRGGMAIFVIAVLAIVVVSGLAWGLPTYNVWTKELSGKADLRKAEWNRQIAVEEAKALLEAEKLNAQSEVERAKGVAEANSIIATSITEPYLRYLWVKGLQDGSSETIYIPTEANIPILEATRLGAT